MSKGWFSGSLVAALGRSLQMMSWLHTLCFGIRCWLLLIQRLSTCWPKVHWTASRTPSEVDSSMQTTSSPCHQKKNLWRISLLNVTRCQLYIVKYELFGHGQSSVVLESGRFEKEDLNATNLTETLNTYPRLVPLENSNNVSLRQQGNRKQTTWHP